MIQREYDAAPDTKVQAEAQALSEVDTGEGLAVLAQACEQEVVEGIALVPGTNTIHVPKRKRVQAISTAQRLTGEEILEKKRDERDVREREKEERLGKGEEERGEGRSFKRGIEEESCRSMG